MIQMHPDELHSHVDLRQDIVRQGVIASRHPGDLAGLRERIGQLLISVGERVRGHQVSVSAAAPIPGRVMQLAR